MNRRLVAAWRRLFAPPPPSPAMEKFLGWLAETPYQWYIASDGKIRAREEDTEVCAVTGVVRNRAGVIFSLGEWVRAANMIGLSYMEAGIVVEAADAAWPSGIRTNLLRERLLVAARIESSPATASVTPDPMDHALADLIANRVGTNDLCPSPVEQDRRDERELVPA